MIPLSPDTKSKLSRIFPPEDIAEATELLVNECADNLPFYEDADPFSLERIRFAVIKLSKGDLDTLIDQIDLAQIDWRDSLMAAGFGHSVEAHKDWNP